MQFGGGKDLLMMRICGYGASLPLHPLPATSRREGFKKTPIGASKML